MKTKLDDRTDALRSVWRQPARHRPTNACRVMFKSLSCLVNNLEAKPSVFHGVRMLGKRNGVVLSLEAGSERKKHFGNNVLMTNGFFFFGGGGDMVLHCF